MLPAVNVNNKTPYPGYGQRKKPPRARPINPSDTAATTGLALNPNGTYVANSYPMGNAMYGQQGQYGAMLPAVNVDAYRNTYNQGAQYGPVGSLFGAANAASQFATDFVIPGTQGVLSYGANAIGQGLQQGWNQYRNAYADMATPQNIQNLALVAPGLARGLQNSANAYAGNMGNRPGYLPAPPVGSAQSRLAPVGYGNNAAQPTGTPYTPGGSFVPGRYSQQAMNQHMQQIQLYGDSYLNNLSQDTRSAVLRMLNIPDPAAAPVTLDAQGNSYDADASQSPGGRFIQVGEKRWERNKNGRLVQVQYTGGGSWRNKRVVSGGKNQSRSKQPQQQRQANYTLANSFVNFNTSTG